MKTLIIVDHPYFDRSVVNRRWIDELRKYPDDILIHNLQSSYPHAPINVGQEHSLIENNGAVVFQFPLFWFNSPPMLKSWFDTVLTAGWAYKGGNKLEGKHVALAVTTGGAAEKYDVNAGAQYSLEDYVRPYIQALKYCGADFKGVYAFYGANTSEGESVDASAIAVSARNYVEFINNMAMK